MNNSKENVWYSGDWKSEGNNITIPYNGLKIAAKANYTLQTSPPTTQKLLSVDLEVVDYTYDPNGVSSFLSLYKTGVWYSIQIPENNKVSPPQPNSKFTVIGTDNITLGKVMLDAISGGIYLNIQFRYGVESRKREELGFIMKFDQTYQQGQNPIQVEGADDTDEE